jgi:hypothetical protein
MNKTAQTVEQLVAARKAHTDDEVLTELTLLR